MIVLKHWLQVRSWGYTPVTVSAHSGLGLQPLLDALVGKVSVFAGPSGVGKSSLLNVLKRDETVTKAAAGLAAHLAAEDAASFGTAAAAAAPAEQQQNGAEEHVHSAAVSDAAEADASGQGGSAAITATQPAGRVAWSAFGERVPAVDIQRAITAGNGSSRAGDEIDHLQVRDADLLQLSCKPS